MIARYTSALFLIITIVSSTLCKDADAVLFGDKLFAQRNNRYIEYDTVAQMSIDQKYVYELKNPGSLALTILMKNGYILASYQQYKWELPELGKISGSKASFVQILLSNVLLKEIKHFTIDIVENRYTVRLLFSKGGSSDYDGAQALDSTPSIINFGDRDLKTFFYSSFDPGSQIFRKVYNVLIVSPDPINIPHVKKLVNAEMDKMKVDMRYKCPGLILLHSPTDTTSDTLSKIKNAK